jgi:hypothetical protein
VDLWGKVLEFFAKFLKGFFRKIRCFLAFFSAAHSALGCVFLRIIVGESRSMQDLLKVEIL